MDGSSRPGDLITRGPTAPRADHKEATERTARPPVGLLTDGVSHRVRAWIPAPVLPAGGQTATRVEPACGGRARRSAGSRRPTG
ncbi:M81 family metallopeptidase [Streptomyces sp. NPDC088358]|uniref:M81 family metallopeptidase n=1 Tax=Streptomyces sp. NPDC088358 TaxID=3365857 RepID=UPI003818B769